MIQLIHVECHPCHHVVCSASWSRCFQQEAKVITDWTNFYFGVTMLLHKIGIVVGVVPHRQSMAGTVAIYQNESLLQLFPKTAQFAHMESYAFSLQSPRTESLSCRELGTTHF